VRSAGRRHETNAEGAGLGLAIVNKLVQAWGGSLQLDQRNVTAEPSITVTSVTFTMPFTAMPLPPAAQEAGERDPV
jgi:signal transduction histidine kinase